MSKFGDWNTIYIFSISSLKHLVVYKNVRWQEMVLGEIWSDTSKDNISTQIRHKAIIVITLNAYKQQTLNRIAI